MKLDSWEQALADAMGEHAETVPDGWITLDEFAERIKRGPVTARTKMNRLLALGSAEQKSFRVQRGERMMQTKHYKLKK